MTAARRLRRPGGALPRSAKVVPEMPPMRGEAPADARVAGAPQSIVGDPDASLLDIVDNVLNKGIVLTGDVTIGLAQVDLIYAQLSVLLCAADRVLPRSPDRPRAREGRAQRPAGRPFGPGAPRGRRA